MGWPQSSDVPLPPRLAGNDLRIRFGAYEAVRGVSVNLLPGEVHAIVGENGAGKSSVAKMLAGVYRPTSGQILREGEPVELESPRAALERGIALIHQEPLTFPDLSVAENIFAGHQPVRGGRLQWAEMKDRAQKTLEELGTRIDVKGLAGGLSIADQQNIELASALLHQAQVLLLDETTAALTPEEVSALFRVVRQLRDGGKAIAFVSHRLDEVFDISDRITVMRDGEKVAELVTRETAPAEVIRFMVGREVSMERPAPRPRPTTSACLRVTDLSCPGKFERVSFEVGPGEIVGLAGLVGAGRTEVCEAIFGVWPPAEGRIEWEGDPVRFRSPEEAVRKGVAMVPEDRQHHGLLTPLAIADNVNLATLRGIWNRPRREVERAESLMGRVRTKMRSVRQPVSDLSGGNQQKVVLCKWLASEPRLLILDEPTRGVDIGAKEEVHQLIRELADQGMAVLMVSSDLEEVIGLSDRVLVMRAGRLVAQLSGEDITRERVMAAAVGAHAAA